MVPVYVPVGIINNLGLEQYSACAFQGNIATILYQQAHQE